MVGTTGSGRITRRMSWLIIGIEQKHEKRPRVPETVAFLIESESRYPLSTVRIVRIAIPVGIRIGSIRSRVVVGVVAEIADRLDRRSHTRVQIRHGRQRLRRRWGKTLSGITGDRRRIHHGSRGRQTTDITTSTHGATVGRHVRRGHHHRRGRSEAHRGTTSAEVNRTTTVARNRTTANRCKCVIRFDTNVRGKIVAVVAKKVMQQPRLALLRGHPAYTQTEEAEEEDLFHRVTLSLECSG